MAEKGVRTNRRCYYCDQEGHIARACPKKERDRLKQQVCFGCGGSGHVKRNCPQLGFGRNQSPSSQHPESYRRSCSSSPGTAPTPVSEYAASGRRRSDGQRRTLGSVSNKPTKSYSSVAAGNKYQVSDSNTERDTHLCQSDISHHKDDTGLRSSRECLQANQLQTIGDIQSTVNSGTHQSSNSSPEITSGCTSNIVESLQSPDSGTSSQCASHSEEDTTSTVTRQSTIRAEPEKRKRSHFPPFIDTHCHLEYVFDRYHHRGTFKDFADQYTYPTNYGGCISTFCDPAAFSSIGCWPELLSESNVWGSFGIHPHNAKYYHTNGLEDKLLKGLQHPKCVAFGEIGLDYSEHSPSDPQTQREILRHQLQLVVAFGKPVVLHCRDAEQELLRIITEMLPRDWLIHLHCFTGEPYVGAQFMDEFPNLYLGICGNVTNPRQINMRTIASEVPLERLLIETDAPYHVPSNLPKVGWCRNSHPALAFYVAKEISRLRKADLVEVLQTVRTNTRTLYGV